MPGDRGLRFRLDHLPALPGRPPVRHRTSTGRPWRWPRTRTRSASTRCGCPSTTSSTTPTCRRCCPCARRSPPGPGASGSAPRCCCAPLHDPVRLAEDAAVRGPDLRRPPGARPGPGLAGRGVRRAGHPARRTGYRACSPPIEVLRQAWSGDLVRAGTVRDHPGMPVRPLPAQPGGPPLWVGGLTEPAIRRAGRVADGFMATEVTPAACASRPPSPSEERARGAGDGPFTISVQPADVHMGRARRSGAHPRPPPVRGLKYDDMDAARGRCGRPARRPRSRRARTAQLRASIVMAPRTRSPGRSTRTAARPSWATCTIAAAVLPGRRGMVQQRTLRLFAEQVIPRARALAARGAA